LAGDKDGESITTVKAESRRLMLEKIETTNGEIRKCTFLVNIRSPKISDTLSIKLNEREIPYLNWDNKLTLEFNDKNPCICGIEIEPVAQVRTLFIAGNSTVTDQNYEPWASWGQMITRFLNDRIVVANFAESGESLRSSYNSKRLDKVLSLMKPNDYFLIEFGHNDQKIKGDENGAYGTYSDYLRMHIDKCKEKGGIPVLITSMHRRKFDDNGKIINSLGDFPDAMRKIAKEKSVSLIDLNAMSKVLYETWGIENSIKAFCYYPANTYPNQPVELKDNTHFNNYGAYHITLCILQGIVENDIDIDEYILDDFKGFNPKSPISFNDWELPESSLVSNDKPLGN
jgi:lysophospholipase L1-like esterase